MSLENILRQTMKVGGRELRLLPGRKLVVVTAAGEREVQGPEQTSESIRQLLEPILTRVSGFDAGAGPMAIG